MTIDLLILNLLAENQRLQRQLNTCPLTGVGSRHAYQQRQHQGEAVSYLCSRFWCRSVGADEPMTLTRDQLHDQLDAAHAEAERWEALASTLSEALDSAAYVLAQVCHANGLCDAPGDCGRAIVAQLIADLGEDELAELLATLPTGWRQDEPAAAEPESGYTVDEARRINSLEMWGHLPL